MKDITRGWKIALASIISVPVVIAISLMGLLVLDDHLRRNPRLWR